MKKSVYKEFAKIDSSHWWHVGRQKIIEKQLAAVSNSKSHRLKILNVGAGTGGTIPTLEKFGEVTNADVSKEAVRYLKLKGYESTYFNSKKLPFKNSSFDVVAALDVLEHTENDLETLIDWLRVLRPGGTLLITVPAYQWLWSDHDEANMHYRRYTKKSLLRVLDKAGVQDINKVSYMIVFSLPLIVGFRMLKKIKKRMGKTKKSSTKIDSVKIPASINSFFIKVLSFEGILQKIINFPFGTSVIANVQKPK